MARAEKPAESRSMSVLKFTAGWVAAYAYHEAGHALAAAVTDTDMEWGIGTYNQPLGFTEHAKDDHSGVLVHTSGLVTQLIASEIILQADSIDKNDNFVRGMMFWNILNPIVYSLDYWIIRRTNKKNGDSYQGDIEGLENYSSKTTANAFAFGITALAAYQGYRFARTQDWAPEWIRNGSVRLNFESFGRDGTMLKLEIDF